MELQALPGMRALLDALRGLAPAYLVGGAVRDLLRGASVVDLDLAVEGDAAGVARSVAERVGGAVVEHDRFGTAAVRSPALSVDFATTRRETYPSPGALPAVEPAGLEDDLARRDFTVNAMAYGLTGPREGELVDPFGGRADLEAGVIRVLHERSFVDDPTRLLRALCYEARLGGRLDDETESLARAAVASGAPATVSGKRIRDELLDLLAEPEAASALGRMREIGLDAALHPALRADADRVASAQLACAETGADPVLAGLAALLAPDPEALGPWLDGLALARGEHSRVARAAASGPALARTLRGEMQASEIHSLLVAEPAEALAVALAFGAPGDPVLRFARNLRDARLEISGDDLVTAGVPESAAIGRALAEVLRRKLDGEVAGRSEELALALALAREEAE